MFFLAWHPLLRTILVYFAAYYGMFFYFLRVIQSFRKILLRFSLHNSDSFCITFFTLTDAEGHGGTFFDIFFSISWGQVFLWDFAQILLTMIWWPLDYKKNYMLLPSAIIRFFGGHVGVCFSISWEWFNFYYLLLLGWPGTHTHADTHTYTHTHTHT